MNDMERRKFEDSFKDAFQDAQLTPTENVWTNIELDLERASGDKMKRRLLFFKLLAAASVAFAMCVAGIGYYVYDLQSTELTAQRGLDGNLNGNQHAADVNTSEAASSSNEIRSTQPLASGSADVASQKDSGNSTANSSAKNVPVDDGDRTEAGADHSQRLATADRNNERKVSPEMKRNPTATEAVAVIRSHRDGRSLTETKSNAAASDGTPDYSSGNITASEDKNVIARQDDSAKIPAVSGKVNSFALESQRPLSPLVVPENAKVPPKEESTADPFMLMMARLDDEARAINQQYEQRKKDNVSKEQLWTSVGMTAGAYNTVNRSIANDMHSNAIQTATDQVKASGVTYSFGLSVGTKVSDRWVVQGGVNYLNQMSDYTSNIIVGGNVVGQFNAMNGTNAALLSSASDSKQLSRNDTEVNWAQTPPFAVTNTMEFISIPLEAGYLVVDKKVGVMVNAGVSTDLFIQNTEAANVDGAANPVQTQGRGSSDSPFRDVNFVGLVGTEVSYKVGSRYRVALTPGLRYPFNSMYKDDSRIQATPVTFDVGLKFRYIFQ